MPLKYHAFENIKENGAVVLLEQYVCIMCGAGNFPWMPEKVASNVINSVHLKCSAVSEM